jgi:hypothetical protein
MQKLSLCVLALLALAAVAVSLAGGAGTAKALKCLSPDAPHADGEWRVAIGVFSTRASAFALARRAATAGFRNLGIEEQVGPRYVVSLNGMHTRRQVSEEIVQVKSARLQVVGTETELSPCR